MKIAAAHLLLVSSIALVSLTGQALAATAQTTTSQNPASAAAASPDLALSELLIQVQANAQKTDQDLAQLRVEKWKADPASKQQAEASVVSIRRNLTNAVPDLLQRIQASPGSLNANFRLYRNMNALYDTFSTLAESAGAFAPNDQFKSLSADVYQLDQLRRQIAERVDMLAGANDAELARLRARLGNTTAGTKSSSNKVVVDDSKPAPKKKPKPAPSQQ
jgi:hypothetical protein